MDPLIQNIGWGPTPHVRLWPMYFVNGYKFHTVEWSNSRSTENYGVCMPRQELDLQKHITMEKL